MGLATYSNSLKIYSVDLMFAYINLFHPPISIIEVKKLQEQLEYPSWGDPKMQKYFSPMDVLKKQKNKKYLKNMERIQKADLSYPIILDGNDIVDGIHRLTKAVQEKKKTIVAYCFDKKLMNKFLIDIKGDWDRVDQIKEHELIELFYQRFCPIGSNKKFKKNRPITK